MKNVMFVSVNSFLKGGIASVIKQYQAIFKSSIFFYSKSSDNGLLDWIFLPFTILKYIYELFKKKDVSIVHIHGASRGSFYRKYLFFFIAKYIFRKKVVYHIHGGGFHKFYTSSNFVIKILVKHFINSTDVVICLSKSWESFFNKNFKPKRIEVVPNFTLKKKYKQHKIEQGKVIFLFLGKIMTAKGVYDLVEVVKNLSSQYNDKFELWIGGDGEHQKLNSLIYEYKLEGYIKYLGWISGERKDYILSLANVYVLPSYNEGVPISILESMAVGMPIISTNVGGIPEVVEDGETGFLIEPGDLECLKLRLESFIVNNSLLEQMGLKGYNFIQNSNSIEVAVKKLNDIYTSLSKIGNKEYYDSSN